MRWSNVGVAKLYRSYRLRLWLLDATGRPLTWADSPSDPRDWLPGDHQASTRIDVPATLEPGTYTLAIALVDPAAPTRAFRLAFAAPQRDGRYEIGSVRIE